MNSAVSPAVSPAEIASRERFHLNELAPQMRLIQAVLNQVRSQMLSPDARKRPPFLPSPDVTRMLGISPATFNSRIQKGTYPPPSARLTRDRRMHSLEDVRKMMRLEGKALRCPEGQSTKTIVFHNAKGGVGKSTLATSMAQRAARMGSDVLLIDLDPQGSATTLCGLIPEMEVSAEQTAFSLMPFARPGVAKLRDLAQTTYWPGLDLVPACVALGLVDLEMSRFVASNPRAESEAYGAIARAIAQTGRHYDLIFIDTPPAVNHLTLAATLAADGVVIPTGLSYVDFVASAGFWVMLENLAPVLETTVPNKTWDFVKVVANKTYRNSTASSLVRMWLESAYGHRRARSDIIDTRAIDAAAALSSGTVYDLHGVHIPASSAEDAPAHRETLERALSAFDALGEELDEILRAIWGIAA